jgi:hypothetical protein
MRLLLVSVLLLGCSAGSGAKIRMVPNVVAGTQSLSKSGQGAVGAQGSALRIGSPTASNLRSLKYYITGIQLCQDVQLAGSGYSGASGCIELYGNTRSDPRDYEAYAVEQALADDTAGHYVDLMTAEGQAALRRPVTLEVAVADPNAHDAGPSPSGAYRFGMISFFRPIKVTAEFPVLGSSSEYFRTRAVTQIDRGPTLEGGHNSQRVEIGDTLSGPTEETTYMLNNGGALFTFQKPFAITQADIDAQAEISVDLVFNPENFGQAYETQGCASDTNIAICDPTNNVVIDMPYVHMSPVPRKSGEKTRKETYLMDYDADSKLRIELYYNDADNEASVQGVDVAVVYAPSARTRTYNVISSNFVSQTGHLATHDASLTLMDYTHTPNLDGLIRRQNGTVSIHCLLAGAICPSSAMDVMRTYSYVGDSVVSAD